MNRRSLTLSIGLFGLSCFVVLAIVAPFVWGTSAQRLDPANAQLSGSSDHWFGTDSLGRDVFARTMVATRLTLLMCAGSTAIAAVLGIGLGAVIWVAGPRVRRIGQRLIDVMVSYPSVIFALIVVAILGPGVATSVVAIGLGMAPAFARLTTNLAASTATKDFVSTSRLLGVAPLAVLRRHILPNIAESLLVLLSVAFTISLKALSGLSFLGVGVQEPSFDWGALLAWGLQGIYVNPAPALGPAAVIVLAGLASGLIGDGLAASANPSRASGRRRLTLRTVTAIKPPDGAVATVTDLQVAMADGTVLVDGISFAIGRGEVVGLVGESGSGKSLTAMALAQLLPEGLTPTAATLSVGDLDLTSTSDPARLATAIGVVYQDPGSSFNPTLRVGGQVTESLTVHMGIGRDEAKRRAVAALESVHVTLPEKRMGQHPHELSGGMRQRTMIASARMTNPTLIIADEPTTALDVTVQAEVLRLLREANERDGTAVLMISHDVGVVASICDRVLVMYAGRIVEELSAERLKAREASHPYTRALLAAVPDLDSPLDVPLQTIPGRPPQPGERLIGCAFADRCELARDVCHENLPPSTPTPAGSAACYSLSWDVAVEAQR